MSIRNKFATAGRSETAARRFVVWPYRSYFTNAKMEEKEKKKKSHCVSFTCRNAELISSTTAQKKKWKMKVTRYAINAISQPALAGHTFFCWAVTASACCCLGVKKEILGWAMKISLKRGTFAVCHWTLHTAIALCWLLNLMHCTIVVGRRIMCTQERKSLDIWEKNGTLLWWLQSFCSSSTKWICLDRTNELDGRWFSCMRWSFSCSDHIETQQCRRISFQEPSKAKRDFVMKSKAEQ